MASLHDKFPDLQILAFPCNQFMEEESQCNIDIKHSVKKKFGINFPMFAKIDVNGKMHIRYIII
jgi:glutathione peroxidase